MTRLDRRGAFYLTCMAIAILLPLLFHWRERLWMLWVWLWKASATISTRRFTRVNPQNPC